MLLVETFRTSYREAVSLPVVDLMVAVFAGAPGAVDQGLFANLHAYVQINPALAPIAERLQLKRLVPMAVDQAIVEIITPVVERSVTIACMTAQELIVKVRFLFIIRLYLFVSKWCPESPTVAPCSMADRFAALTVLQVSPRCALYACTYYNCCSCGYSHPSVGLFCCTAGTK